MLRVAASRSRASVRSANRKIFSSWRSSISRPIVLPTLDRVASFATSPEDHSRRPSRQEQSTVSLREPTSRHRQGRRKGQGRYGQARGGPSPTMKRISERLKLASELASIGTNGEDSLAVLKPKTAALLAVRTGSWSPEQWRDCVQQINEWTAATDTYQAQENVLPKFWGRSPTRTRPAEIPSVVPVTAESVISSFNLLERLLLENRRGANALMPREVLDTGLLNKVVRNWAICWRQLHPSSSDDEAKRTQQPQMGEDAENQATILLDYNPENILRRIDGYQNRSNNLLTANRFTYTTIVAAAAASGTPSIATKILDRMTGKDTNDTSANNNNDNNSKAAEQQQRTAVPGASKQTQQAPIIGVDRRLYDTFITIFAKMGDAAQAEAVLEHMYDQFVKTGSVYLMPSTKEFKQVLLAWSASGDLKYASERSQAILRKMDRLSAPGGELEGVASPDAKCYGLVMVCLSRWVANVVELETNAREYEFMGELAESLLKEMQQKYENGGGGRNVRPNRRNYNLVLAIWSQLGNAERAEQILEAMYQDFRVNKNFGAKPTRGSFDRVLNAWWNQLKVEYASSNSYAHFTETKSSAVGERAEAIFRRLQECHRSGLIPGVKPIGRSWLAVMHCWSETRSEEAGDRALALLEEARAVEKETGEEIVNTVFYGVVIHAYASAGNAEAAEKALSEFNRSYYEEGNRFAKPTMQNLSILMNAWAKSDNPKAAERADTLLQEMKKLYQEGILDSPPSIVSYSSVLECYAKSPLPGATERAEALLDEIEGMSRDGEDMRPNVIAYRNLLFGYANRGMVDETEAVLERMFEDYKRGNVEAKPTAKAMNLVLTALSKSHHRDAGTRAVAYLKRMEKLYEMQKFDNPPDVVSYTLALLCIAKSNNKQGGEQAEKLLDEMERRAKLGDTYMAPNTMSYSTVIQIYGSAGRPEKAEDMLRRMYKAYTEANSSAAPNARSFSSVLQGWARSGSSSAPARAEAILSWMKDLHNDGVLDAVKPNQNTYGAVLACLALSTDKDICQKAMGYLEEMEELGDPQMAPPLECYNHVLRTHAKFGDGMKAQELIARMYHKVETGKLSDKPDMESWQYVVEAWCRSKDTSAPSRVGMILERINQLSDSGFLEERPSAQAYLMMLESLTYSRHRGLREHIDPILNALDVVALAADTGTDFSMFDQLKIIRALCKLKDDEKLVRAEGFLQRMLKRNDPSSRYWNKNAVKASYTALIKAWSKSRDPQAKDHAARLERELKALNISFDDG